MTDVQPTVVEDPVVTPRASTPITIGELTDVPAPGSLVAAGWAQEVSDRIIHRFANNAAMNGWAAANGAMAYSAESGSHYRRAGGNWVVVTDSNALASVNTTAVNASNAATAAQNTANAANGTATTALNTANAAQGTANTANNAAQNAQNTANSAQGGVNNLNAQVKFGTQGGYPNITTDGNGDARINFPYGFQSIPGVAAVTANLANVQCTIHSVDTGGFSVRCFFAPGGNPPVNAPWQGTTALGWVASGAWLA